MASVELRNIIKTFHRKREDNSFFALGGGNALCVLAPEMVAKKLVQDKYATKQPEKFNVEGLCLTIPEGKTLVILGPSGCGKTTLLRLIAGLDQPNSGQVLFNSENVTQLAAKDRNIGMVFQNYALYPHMKAKSNVLSFFFFHRKTEDMILLKSEKYKKTSELMGIDIEYLLDRNISNLSGGEKQRIAIARCITRDPSVFLLDEPFSNLDAKLRAKYRIELHKLLSALKVTTVYVTHDQEEALILADVIAVMDFGKIAQVGTYEELYKNPASIFVAEFLNPNTETPAVNLLDGKSISPELSEFKVGVRPEDVEIVGNATAGTSRALVSSVRPVPVKGISIVTLRTKNEEITTTAPIDLDLKIDTTVSIKFRRKLLFRKDTGLRVE